MVAFPDTGITGTQYFFFKNVTTNTTYLITDNNGIFDITTVFNNAVLYPMITTDLNATYADYVPYAKTNRELTEVKVGTPTALSGYSLFSGYDNKVYRCGNLVFVNLMLTDYTLTSSQWANVATLPEGFRPKNYLNFSCIEGINGDAPHCRILSNGLISVWSKANTHMQPYVCFTFIS